MRLIESKSAAWSAIILVVLLIALSFMLHTPWYGYFALFFLFLSVFSHISSLYLRRMSAIASRKLEMCAFVLLILAVVGFIAEYIVFFILVS